MSPLFFTAARRYFYNNSLTTLDVNMFSKNTLLTQMCAKQLCMEQERSILMAFEKQS